VLVSSTVNTYVADFRNTPLDDTQLFAGVTPTVLEKSFKNPNAWRTPQSV